MAPIRLFILGAICFYLSHFTAEGGKGRSKDVIKTIKTKDGVYDCVDFYKQPALKHPLLKDHSFSPEMTPSFRPNMRKTNEFSDGDSIGIELKRISCPKGTVPIRRLSKEDQLLQTKMRRDHYAHLGKKLPNDNGPQQSKAYMLSSFRPNTLKANEFSTGDSFDIELNSLNYGEGTIPIRRLSEEDQLWQTQMRREHYAHFGKQQSKFYYAMAQSPRGSSQKFRGIGSTLSVYNPRVHPSQFSSGEIVLKGGNDAIIVGWTVNPIVYKENRTRMFTYAIAGDQHCFNSACGFVIVREDIAIDAHLEPVTIPFGRTIYKYQWVISQDKEFGNWWLFLGFNNTAVGFWPRKIFKGLSQIGDYVACGGEAYGPTNLGYPQMGSGYMPNVREPTASAYCMDTYILNEANDHVAFDDFEKLTNDPSHYNILHNKRQHIADYGGPNVSTH